MPSTIQDGNAGRHTGPFAMFGHCLGAVLGHELAHELVGHGQPPAWLGVSGSPPPHATTENLRRMVTEWSQAGLIQLARALGGMPEQVWANEPLAERILRTFRADLSIIAGYRFPVRPPLPMPVSVFGGEADPYVDGTQIRAWNGTGTGPAAVRIWPGGHFYLYDHAAEVCAYLVDDAVAAVERSR
jgi:surfactin synthase thioesterase subunit